VAGPGIADALRVAAELVPAGVGLALEHSPGPGEDVAAVLAELVDGVRAAGLAAVCEVTLPVDRLGIAATRALAAAAADGGPAVALTGASRSVRAAADGLEGAAVVVPAGWADAESLCRAYADGRVRLTAGGGARTDLAFVRCLNVLMAGRGHPSVAAFDPRLVAITGERAVWNDRSPDSWEYVMPHGIRTEMRRRLVAGGAAVRVAVPSGPRAAGELVGRLVGRS
jgi:proline dehydrogenase